MEARAFSPPASQTVTASELVRRFGEWQRRAAQAPVYILHHRRPQFVLASVELMQALSAQGHAADPDGVARILDALPEPVLIADATGRIVAAGRGARLYFGDRAAADAAFGDILPAETAAFLTGIVARVAASGLAEQAELPADGTHARLELAVEPHPAGVLLVGRAGGLADARDAANAQAQALATALAALPDAAFATIGPRGYLIEPDESLARMSGYATGALASVRAVSLFTMASRVALGDAIEAVFATGAPATSDGDLLTGGTATVPVSLGLAPLRRGLTVSAVLAVIVKRSCEGLKSA